MLRGRVSDFISVLNGWPATSVAEGGGAEFLLIGIDEPGASEIEFETVGPGAGAEPERSFGKRKPQNPDIDSVN